MGKGRGNGEGKALFGMMGAQYSVQMFFLSCTPEIFKVL